MSRLLISYDPWRGGFLLQVAAFKGENAVELPDGLATAFRGASGRFAGVQSWWRLPLRRIHISEFDFWRLRDGTPLETLDNKILRTAREHNSQLECDFRAACPEGTFPVSGDFLRVKAFHLRQAPDKFSVWFSHGDVVPRTHWLRENVSEYGVALWFSPRTLPLHEREVKLNRPPRRLFAGMEVPFASSEAAFPITEIHLSVCDFK